MIIPRSNGNSHEKSQSPYFLVVESCSIRKFPWKLPSSQYARQNHCGDVQRSTAHGGWDERPGLTPRGLRHPHSTLESDFSAWKATRKIGDDLNGISPGFCHVFRHEQLARGSLCITCFLNLGSLVMCLPHAVVINSTRNIQRWWIMVNLCLCDNPISHTIPNILINRWYRPFPTRVGWWHWVSHIGTMVDLFGGRLKLARLLLDPWIHGGNSEKSMGHS